MATGDVTPVENFVGAALFNTSAVTNAAMVKVGLNGSKVIFAVRGRDVTNQKLIIATYSCDLDGQNIAFVDSYIATALAANEFIVYSWRNFVKVRDNIFALYGETTHDATHISCGIVIVRIEDSGVITGVTDTVYVGDGNDAAAWHIFRCGGICWDEYRQRLVANYAEVYKLAGADPFSNGEAIVSIPVSAAGILGSFVPYYHQALAVGVTIQIYRGLTKIVGAANLYVLSYKSTSIAIVNSVGTVLATDETVLQNGWGRDWFHLVDDLYMVVNGDNAATGSVGIVRAAVDGSSVSLLDNEQVAASWPVGVGPIMFDGTFTYICGGGDANIWDTHTVNLTTGAITKIDTAAVGQYDNMGAIILYEAPTYVLLANGGLAGSKANLNTFTAEKPNPVPTITAISPDHGSPDNSYTATITGTNFVDDIFVLMGAGILVSSVTVASATQLTATISIDEDADLGYRDVTVFSANGSDTLANGFEVTEPQEEHYVIQLPDLGIPYVDEDGTKELHIALENLSPTSKSAGEDGQVVIEIGYEVAG